MSAPLLRVNASLLYLVCGFETSLLYPDQAAAPGAEAADPAGGAGRESAGGRHPAVHGLRGRGRGAQEEEDGGRRGGGGG